MKVEASGNGESMSPFCSLSPETSLMPFIPVHQSDTQFWSATGYAEPGDNILVAYHCLLHNFKVFTELHRLTIYTAERERLDFNYLDPSHFSVRQPWNLTFCLTASVFGNPELPNSVRLEIQTLKSCFGASKLTRKTYLRDCKPQSTITVVCLSPLIVPSFDWGKEPGFSIAKMRYRYKRLNRGKNIIIGYSCQGFLMLTPSFLACTLRMYSRHKSSIPLNESIVSIT